MRRLLPVLFLLISACTEIAPVLDLPPPPGAAPVSAQAARQFVEVASALEPVAERECRARTRGLNCDFRIVIDDGPDQKPNAYQTEDAWGRPVLAFNLGLIAAVQNPDELAFVIGHEAAHHILSHLEQTRRSAMYGAVVASGTAAILGATPELVREAGERGAQIGGRVFSKEFELEADRLGTIITAKAGYDPVRGSAFFTRLPDPGNRFLGTHPPNASRIRVVQQTVDSM